MQTLELYGPHSLGRSVAEIPCEVAFPVDEDDGIDEGAPPDETGAVFQHWTIP